MRFVSSSVLLSAVFFAGGSLGQHQLSKRGGVSSDVCGNVNGLLTVPLAIIPGQTITLGIINTCLCLSGIPNFETTNLLAESAVSLGGEAATTAALTKLVNAAPDHQQCQYPANSSPVCKAGSPCGFECQNGYSASPASRPTQCVCSAPNTECNGKCGIYNGCPSPQPYKRDISSGSNSCPRGFTACGVLGRGAKSSWDCIDAQNDLESCGGCTIPLHGSSLGPEGVDCTALPGVSDVSCVRGGCIVHKCMPGYDMHPTGASCIYQEDAGPQILDAQYGFGNFLA
ncbi:hypothetical protein BD779DRAFT_1004167 [Infundibulicybe gibba]|nr:hypothetical protein BD779DRAFT_1004167 [Infundibulicybe gibba]